MNPPAAHRLSDDDRAFRAAFEEGAIAAAAFDHRAHVRLAYVYLAEGDAERAAERMREGLLRFLRHHGIAPSKYHETMTRAWTLAVAHFMALSPGAASADAFIDANPRLLDSRIMLTHYSAELLFSEEARARFVEPDAEPIPRHDERGR